MHSTHHGFIAGCVGVIGDVGAIAQERMHVRKHGAVGQYGLSKGTQQLAAQATVRVAPVVH